MKETIESVIVREAEAIKNIPVTDDFIKALDIIYNQVHKKKGKIVASGMGKAGQIALNIATTFSSTGTPAMSSGTSNAMTVEGLNGFGAFRA